MKPILFLDIDGVLALGFDKDCQSSKFNADCVHQLNRIIRETDCHLVISSAWRYMVLNGGMSLKGFEYLLRTHGVECVDQVYSLIDRDEWCPCGHLNPPAVLTCETCNREIRRCDLIARWLFGTLPTPYVILDNDDFGFTDSGQPLVQTDGRVGLTESDADRVIALLCPALASTGGTNA